MNHQVYPFCTKYHLQVPTCPCRYVTNGEDVWCSLHLGDFPPNWWFGEITWPVTPRRKIDLDRGQVSIDFVPPPPTDVASQPDYRFNPTLSRPFILPDPTISDWSSHRSSNLRRFGETVFLLYICLSAPTIVILLVLLFNL